MNIEVVRVSGKSNVPSVAGCIVKCFESGERKELELNAIGASALNQSCKAIASSRGLLASKGIDTLVKMGFSTTKIDEQERTMMVLKIVVI